MLAILIKPILPPPKPLSLNPKPCALNFKRSETTSPVHGPRAHAKTLKPQNPFIQEYPYQNPCNMIRHNYSATTVSELTG